MSQVQGHLRDTQARLTRILHDLGGRAWLRRALLIGSMALSAAVFVVLVHESLPALPLLADADPALLLLAVVVLVIGYLGQTISLHLVGPGSASWRVLLALPWAVSAVNRVTPASSGGAILTVHVLRRHGCSTSEAVARAATVGLMHRIAGWLILCCVLGTSWVVPWPVKAAIALGLLVGATLLIPSVRHRVLGSHSLRGLVPWSVIPGVLLAQLVTRLAPSVILWCCLHALGHPLPMTVVLTVVVTAGLVGSTPIPGGGGAVEAALTAGLHAAGLSLPVAAAAAVLSRLLSYWLPALPGAVLLPFLRDGAVAASPAQRTAADRPTLRREASLTAA